MLCALQHPRLVVVAPAPWAPPPSVLAASSQGRGSLSSSRLWHRHSRHVQSAPHEHDGSAYTRSNTTDCEPKRNVVQFNELARVHGLRPASMRRRAACAGTLKKA